MPSFFDSGRVLLMDGAMGTQLLRAGLQPGSCGEQWNLTQPQRVLDIHQAYIRAGARVLLTNTFQANPINLKRHGLLEQGPDIASAAVRLARSVAGPPPFVLSDIGPIAETPAGVAFPRKETLDLVAQWLSGADAYLLETCSDRSAFQAVSWLRQASDLPVWLSMTYRTDAQRGICTCDLRLPEEVAEKAVKVGAAALGVNCGLEQDMDRIAEVIRRYRQVTDLPLFARPNAGTPVAGRYPGTPEIMAGKVGILVEAGVALIGGCCGTTPELIAAFAQHLAV